MSRGFESLTCAKTLPGSIDSRSHCSNNIPARTASWENVAAAVGAKRSCWKYLLGQRLSERWPCGRIRGRGGGFAQRSEPERSAGKRSEAKLSSVSRRPKPKPANEWRLKTSHFE